MKSHAGESLKNSGTWKVLNAVNVAAQIIIGCKPLSNTSASRVKPGLRSEM